MKREATTGRFRRLRASAMPILRARCFAMAAASGGRSAGGSVRDVASTSDPTMSRLKPADVYQFRKRSSVSASNECQVICG
jgi:hypothetical protein